MYTKNRSRKTIKNAFVLTGTLVEKKLNRQKGKVKYPIEEILFIMFIGTMLARNDVMITLDFCERNLSFLRLFFPYKNGIPSKSTIYLIMGKTNKQSIDKLLALQIKKEEPLFLCIDGKYLRGNKNKTPKQNKKHSDMAVTAFDSINHFVENHFVIGSKTRENTCVKKLIKAIKKGEYRIITFDAESSNRETISLIIEKGCDYLVPIKKNNKVVFEDIETSFLLNKEKISHQYFARTNSGKSLKEISILTIENDIINKFSPLNDWAGLQTIIREKTISDKGKISYRYFITSLMGSPQQLGKIIKDHWKIETFHKELDVILGEDYSHIKNKNTCYFMHTIRAIVSNIVANFYYNNSYYEKKYSLERFFQLLNDDKRLLLKVICFNF